MEGDYMALSMAHNGSVIWLSLVCFISRLSTIYLFFYLLNSFLNLCEKKSPWEGRTSSHSKVFPRKVLIFKEFLFFFFLPRKMKINHFPSTLCYILAIAFPRNLVFWVCSDLVFSSAEHYLHRNIWREESFLTLVAQKVSGKSNGMSGFIM